MIRFLIHRPIAVTMAFIAIMALGVLAAMHIPVSLMPDINIPEIRVQVSRKNVSARELENTVVAPLRQQLAQVAHINDISSETRDEHATISLRLDYGTKTDFAFIEVNEKIDRAMSTFPRDVERPKVIKASATDIPVFYLNITLKDQQDDAENTRKRTDLFPVSQKFIELSEFATQVIKKRLEQLSDVAMVDISGVVRHELLIIPNLEKLQSVNISLDQLEHHIRSKNLNLGSLLIHDGQYQYNIRFNSILRDKKDIEDIYFHVDNRLFQLKDLAEVVEHPQQRKGMVISDGDAAVTMAIIKQSDAQLGDLQKSLEEMIGYFQYDYPHLKFSVTRDQTKLLDYSISNLNQDLFWGGLLAFLVMFLFLKDFKSPLLIGVTLPASLIVSLIFFYLLDISINIISLSGLVLGVGMMIDNSIIVIDNIAHFRQSKIPLVDACIKGGNEVFVPMLSSVLTTCAVFIPLIYISGIAGALFYDEAMSVVIGAFVSLVISVTLIPVYYGLFYRNQNQDAKGWLHKINGLNYEVMYEKSFKFVMRNQIFTWLMLALLVLFGGWIFQGLPKSKMPPLTKEEIIVTVDWNEKINIEENNKRVQKLVSVIKVDLLHYTAWIGEQQFLLHNNAHYSAQEALLYLKTGNKAALERIQLLTTHYFANNFPHAVFSYSDADNIFNFMFADNELPLTAKLRLTKDVGDRRNELLLKTLAGIQKSIPTVHIQQAPLQEHVVLRADPLKMTAYDINTESLYGKLKSAFSAREIFLITTGNDFVPVILGDKTQSIDDILSKAYISNSSGKQYPIRELVSEIKDYDLKTIIAAQAGEYYPVNMNIQERDAPEVMNRIKSFLKTDQLFEADFTGSIFSNRKLINELTIILLISVVLLYVILAAQFESLTLPLIVLLEIPIDILAAFVFLKIFGAGINLMSLIGMVVMTGIIINDSILKIDTINQLRKDGHPLLKSIFIGGQRRLKPILMTGITTALAMIPLLLTPGLGAELQKPLAVALLGGMTVGTLVSLYFIPMCYFYLLKNEHTRKVYKQN